MAEVWRFFAHEDDFADLDEAGACKRLGRVLSFPTVSSMDAEAVDWQPFDDLRAYMQQAWPRVFVAGEVELVGHSLLVTLGGSDPALKPVMLMGHMDVVPVVPGTEADWTHAPFSGHVDDTYIWGRGAIDMKDQVAGILEAVEYALAHGWEHKRTLLLAFGQDEETTQFGAGAIGRVLEERGVELEFLIDEGDYRIVPAAEYSAGEGWLMHADLAEKGYADIVLRTHSEGGHSSNPYGGTSLEVLSRAITAICDIEWPTRVTDLLAAQLVELGLYTADEIASNKDAIVRECLASKKLYPLVTTTCAPTQIEGGSTGANVMPQDMWANINFRMLEGTSVADVVTRCREVVAAAGPRASAGRDSRPFAPLPPATSVIQRGRRKTDHQRRAGLLSASSPQLSSARPTLPTISAFAPSAFVFRRLWSTMTSASAVSTALTSALPAVPTSRVSASSSPCSTRSRM